MAKHILVTGGSGFIGNYLVKELLKKNYKVSIIDTVKGVLNADYYLTDISDKQISTLIKQLSPDIIIHMAALINGSFDSMYRINVTGTKNIQDSFKGKIIFLSSAMVYQGSQSPFKEHFEINPKDNYALTKKLGEEIIKQNKEHIILRPSIVYGKGQQNQMFLSQLKQHIKNQTKFCMTNGEQLRDFIHVDDLTKAIIKSITTPFTGILNIGYGKSISLKEIINIAKGFHPSLEVEYSLPYRPNEPMNYSMDISKAKNTLDWQPLISIEQNLKEILLE
jgi:UDP-glucose 4-epimerase